MKRKYNTKIADPVFYGEKIIWKATPNSSGIRYYAYTEKGTVKADTLEGIKSLIDQVETDLAING